MHGHKTTRLEQQLSLRSLCCCNLCYGIGPALGERAEYRGPLHPILLQDLSSASPTVRALLKITAFCFCRYSTGIPTHCNRNFHHLIRHKEQPSRLISSIPSRSTLGSVARYQDSPVIPSRLLKKPSSLHRVGASTPQHKCVHEQRQNPAPN